jgi:hypothetical protein
MICQVKRDFKTGEILQVLDPLGRQSKVFDSYVNYELEVLDNLNDAKEAALVEYLKNNSKESLVNYHNEVTIPDKTFIRPRFSIESLSMFDTDMYLHLSNIITFADNPIDWKPTKKVYDSLVSQLKDLERRSEEMDVQQESIDSYNEMIRDGVLSNNGVKGEIYIYNEVVRNINLKSRDNNSGYREWTKILNVENYQLFNPETQTYETYTGPLLYEYSVGSDLDPIITKLSKKEAIKLFELKKSFEITNDIERLKNKIKSTEVLYQERKKNFFNFKNSLNALSDDQELIEKLASLILNEDNSNSVIGFYSLAAALKPKYDQNALYAFLNDISVVPVSDYRYYDFISKHLDNLQWINNNLEVKKPSIEKKADSYTIFDDIELPFKLQTYEAPAESRIKLDKARENVRAILGDSVQVSDDIETVIENMKISGVPWGLFMDGMIYLNEVAEKGTEFHEAFHAVFRMFMTDAQIDRILNAAKKEMNLSPEELQEKMDELRNAADVNKSLTNEQLEQLVYEEWLADKYKEYTDTFKPSVQDLGIIGFFRRMWNAFLKLIGVRSEINALFADINNQRFRNKSIKSNRFIRTMNNKPAFSLLQISANAKDSDGNTTTKYARESETSKIVNDVAALLYDEISNEKFSPEESIKDMFNRILDERSNFYHHRKNKSLNQYLSTLPSSEAKDLKDKLREQRIMFDLPTNRELIWQGVKEIYRMFEYNPFEIYDDVFDPEADVAQLTEALDVSAVNKGGFEMTDRELRQFMSLVTYTTKDPLTGLDIQTSVNGNQVYSSLLKVMASKDIENIMPLLDLMSKDRVQVRAVFQALKQKTGYGTEQFDPNHQLISLFRKNLDKEIIHYVQFLFDSDSKHFLLMSANLEDEVKIQMDEWADNWDHKDLSYITSNPETRAILNRKLDLMRKRMQPSMNPNAKNSIMELDNRLDSSGNPIENSGLLYDILNGFTEVYESEQKVRYKAVVDGVMQSFERVVTIPVEVPVYDADGNRETNPDGTFKTKVEHHLKVDSLEDLTGLTLSRGYLRHSLMSYLYDSLQDKSQFRTMLERLGKIDDYHRFISYSNRKIEGFTKDDWKYITGNMVMSDEKEAKLIATQQEKFNEALESNQDTSPYEVEDFRNINNEHTSGVVGRLRKIAKNNAFFDETLIESNFQDANQNQRYSFIQKSYQVTFTRMLKDPKFRDRLLKEYPWLASNYLLNADPVLVSTIFGDDFNFYYVGDTRQTFVKQRTEYGEVIEDSPSYSNAENRKGETSKSLDFKSLNVLTLGLFAKRSQKKIDLGENQVRNVDFALYYTKVFETKSTDQAVKLPVGDIKTGKAFFDENGITDIALERAYEMFETEIDLIKQTETEIINNMNTLRRFNQSQKTNGEIRVKNNLKINKLRNEISDLRDNSTLELQGIEETDLDLLQEQIAYRQEQIAAKEAEIVELQEENARLELTPNVKLYEGFHINTDGNGMLKREKDGSLTTKSALGRGLDLWNFKSLTKLPGGEDLAQYIEDRKQLTLLKMKPGIPSNDDRADMAALQDRIDAYEKSNNKEAIKALIKKLLDDQIKKYHARLAKNNIIGFDSDNNIVNQLLPSYGEQYTTPEHFIGDMFMNDYINVSAYNSLVDKDPRIRKNAIDAVKRNGGSIAYGDSLGSGNFTVSYIKDIEKTFDLVFGKGEVNRADAQAWMSVERFTFMLKRLGRFPSSITDIVNKSRFGKRLTWKEKEKLDSVNATFNSVKGVYFDGEVYHKLSYAVLLRGWTSFLPAKNRKKARELEEQILELEETDSFKKNNKAALDQHKELWDRYESLWVARKGRETLHNMRIAMHYDGIDEILPESASKLLTPIAATENDNNYYDFSYGKKSLPNKYWRLQVETPSGKTKITSPSQLLQLIDNEQDLEAKARLRGEEYVMSDVVKSYRKALKERVTNAIENAINELGEVDSQGNFTKRDIVNFRDKIYQTLLASNADDNLLDFFRDMTADGKDTKYDYNIPSIRAKFEQLFLAHFSRNVLQQIVPGRKVSLISDYGNNVLYDENEGRVIMEREKDMNREKYYDLDSDGNVIGIKEGYTERRLKWSTPEITGITVDGKFYDAKNFLSSLGLKYTSENIRAFKELTDPNAPVESFNVALSNLIYGADISSEFAEELVNAINKVQEEEFVSTGEGRGYLKDTFRDRIKINAQLGLSEVIMPAWFKELHNLKPGDIVDGSNKEALDSIMTMFGIRIPTQDKHSMIAFKVVDFLPVEMGDVAILPMETVYLAGEDFDIDSKYIIRKDHYVTYDEKGKPVFHVHGEYDKAKIEEKYKDQGGEDYHLWNEYKKYISKYHNGVKRKYFQLRSNYLADQDSAIGEALREAEQAVSDIREQLKEELPSHQRLDEIKEELDFLNNILDDEQNAIDLELSNKREAQQRPITEGQVQEELDMILNNPSLNLSFLLSAYNVLNEFTADERTAIRTLLQQEQEILKDPRYIEYNKLQNEDSEIYVESRNALVEMTDGTIAPNDSFNWIYERIMEMPEQARTAEIMETLENLEASRARQAARKKVQYADVVNRLKRVRDELSERMLGTGIDADSYKEANYIRFQFAKALRTEAAEGIQQNVTDRIKERQLTYAQKSYLEAEQKEIKGELSERSSGLREQLNQFRKQLEAFNNLVLAEAMKENKVPSSFSEFLAHPRHKTLNTSALNNQIVDTNILMYINEGIIYVTYAPVSLDSLHGVKGDPQKIGTSKVMQVLTNRNVEGYEYNTIEGKMQAKEANKLGDQLIGPAAIANVVKAALARANVQMRVPSITFDGKQYRDFGAYQTEDIEFNIIYDADGNITKIEIVDPITDADKKISRIMDELSTVLSAMTDNAKHNDAAKLNLTLDTLGVYTYMIALGMGLNRSMMFANQPVMYEYNNLLSAKNAAIMSQQDLETARLNDVEELTDKYTNISKSLASRIESIIQANQNVDQEVEFGGVEYSNFAELKDAIVSPEKSEDLSLSSKDMIDSLNIFRELNIPVDSEFDSLNQKLNEVKNLRQLMEMYAAAMTQLNTIRSFKRLQLQAKQFINVNSFLRLNQGLKPTFYEQQTILDSIDQFKIDTEKLLNGAEDYVKLRKTSTVIIDIRDLFEANEDVKEITKHFLKIKKVAKEFVISETDYFNDIFNTIIQNLKLGIKDRANKLKQIKEDFLSFISLNAYKHYFDRKGEPIPFSPEMAYSDLMSPLNPNKGKTVVQELEELLSKPSLASLRDNAFIRTIKREMRETSKNDVNRLLDKHYMVQVKTDNLTVNTRRKLDPLQNKKIMNGYRELLSHTDLKVREFAKKLFYNLIVRNGLQFKNKSYIKYITAEMYQDYSDLLKQINKALRDDRWKSTENEIGLEELLGMTKKETEDNFMNLFARDPKNRELFNSMRLESNQGYSLAMIRDKAPEGVIEYTEDFNKDTGKLSISHIDIDITKGADYNNAIESIITKHPFLKYAVDKTGTIVRSLDRYNNMKKEDEFAPTFMNDADYKKLVNAELTKAKEEAEKLTQDAMNDTILALTKGKTYFNSVSKFDKDGNPTEDYSAIEFPRFIVVESHPLWNMTEDQILNLQNNNMEQYLRYEAQPIQYDTYILQNVDPKKKKKDEGDPEEIESSMVYKRKKARYVKATPIMTSVYNYLYSPQEYKNLMLRVLRTQKTIQETKLAQEGYTEDQYQFDEVWIDLNAAEQTLLGENFNYVMTEMETAPDIGGPLHNSFEKFPQKEKIARLKSMESKMFGKRAYIDLGENFIKDFFSEQELQNITNNTQTAKILPSNTDMKIKAGDTALFRIGSQVFKITNHGNIKPDVAADFVPTGRLESTSATILNAINDSDPNDMVKDWLGYYMEMGDDGNVESQYVISKSEGNVQFYTIDLYYDGGMTRVLDVESRPNFGVTEVLPILSDDEVSDDFKAKFRKAGITVTDETNIDSYFDKFMGAIDKAQNYVVFKSPSTDAFVQNAVNVIVNGNVNQVAPIVSNPKKGLLVIDPNDENAIGILRKFFIDNNHNTNNSVMLLQNINDTKDHTDLLLESLNNDKANYSARTLKNKKYPLMSDVVKMMRQLGYKDRVSDILRKGYIDVIPNELLKTEKGKELHHFIILNFNGLNEEFAKYVREATKLSETTKSKLQEIELQTVTEGFKLPEKSSVFDKIKASKSNAYIGYGLEGSNANRYAGLAKEQGIPTNKNIPLSFNTNAFVYVNRIATESELDSTIEDAVKVLEAGGKLLMTNEEALIKYKHETEQNVQDALFDKFPELQLSNFENDNKYYRVLQLPTEGIDKTIQDGEMDPDC